MNFWPFDAAARRSFISSSLTTMIFQGCELSADGAILAAFRASLRSCSGTGTDLYLLTLLLVLMASIKSIGTRTK